MRFGQRFFGPPKHGEKNAADLENLQRHIVHNDGTEQDIAEGDAYVIEPGHDAWVTGDQPFVGFEFDSSAAASYAKPKG